MSIDHNNGISRLHNLVLAVAMLCDVLVVVVGRTGPRCMPLAMKKRLAWFSFSMRACGSVPIVMVIHLAPLFNILSTVLEKDCTKKLHGFRLKSVKFVFDHISILNQRT